MKYLIRCRKKERKKERKNTTDNLRTTDFLPFLPDALNR